MYTTTLLARIINVCLWIFVASLKIFSIYYPISCTYFLVYLIVILRIDFRVQQTYTLISFLVWAIYWLFIWRQPNSTNDIGGIETNGYTKRTSNTYYAFFFYSFFIFTTGKKGKGARQDRRRVCDLFLFLF